MNALFNALKRVLFPSKSARTLTHLIFAKNVRNNYAMHSDSRIKATKTRDRWIRPVVMWVWNKIIVLKQIV